MKVSARLLLLLTLCCGLRMAASDDPALIAQRVADAERQLPWFWSPLLEGLSDAPYTFQMKEARQLLHRSGEASGSSATLEMERIPLEGGAYYRCLMQNGSSPCSPEIAEALERESHAAANFSAEQKASAVRAKEERRLRRLAFWGDFPKAFRFQLVGSTEIAFTPTGKYRSQRDPDTSLLSKIKGQLRFDPATFEITQLQYHMLADAEINARLYRGSDFSITLASVAEHHYLPVKVVVRRELPKGGVETSDTEFAGFHRFAADSSIQFRDAGKNER